jgi:acetamidase/formamidase
MRFLLIPLLTLVANGADYQLKATPGTVAWGYYWSAAKPVLHIKSGDRVEIQTLVAGALFEAGDGHAAQGNGEVDITALETSLVGTFEFVVRKDLHLKAPRGETPTHFIAMGLNPDLTEALKRAVRETIDFLTEKHLSREDAYMLSSTAVDFNVTQAVDGTKGVHAMIPKSIFK